MSKKVPTWMTLGADQVMVRITRPTDMNGVKVDMLTLRAPTVRDVRAATASAGSDDEQRELQLFASLAEVGSKDLESLTLKDYQRLQVAYFRLVQDDEL